MTRVLGTVLAVVLIGFTLLGEWAAPYSPTSPVTAAWAAPTTAHPLGADALGRDVWSRVVAGGRSLVLTAIPAALAASVVGVAGGLAAGWAGRRTDRILTGVADVFLAVPSLLLALVAATRLPGSAAVIVATVCGGAPLTLRVVRDAVTQIRHTGYVIAARTRGERSVAILVREVLPAMSGLVGADLGLRLVIALQIAAALGLLGFGAAPPAPDWALMLRENMTGVALNPAAVAAPAVALGLMTTTLALFAQSTAHRER
ncbi:ABC transporter permease [Nocardiopsis ansamitocini]|uniref:ABC transporter permease n=1 Tax=Nocardiopsis ansamitocini TaxID=1670832 RepID=A0A9W6UKY3_9ACTN|nr:ABC transporter permease subunit [Nocardiopsis ansamitocini]GLU50192.1 ABC transporter permease [Nocardiopsis ansamitocini]